MDMATPKRYSDLKANTFIELCLKLNVDFSHLQFGVVNCCSMTMSCRFSRKKLLSSWKRSFYIFELSRVTGNTNGILFCHLIINSHLNRLTNVDISSLPLR